MLPVKAPTHINPNTIKQVEQAHDGYSDAMFAIIGDKFVKVDKPITCDAVIAFQSGITMPSELLQGVSRTTPVGIVFLGNKIINPTPDSPMIWFGKNTNSCPLLGRDYLYGIHDCLSLVRDYYLKEFKIQFDDPIRTPDWWKTNNNQMKLGYQERGFVPVRQPEQGDVMLMCCPGMTEPTHVGIYHTAQKTYHHLWGRKSEQTSIAVLERAGFKLVEYLRFDN